MTGDVGGGMRLRVVLSAGRVFREPATAACALSPGREVRNCASEVCGSVRVRVRRCRRRRCYTAANYLGIAMDGSHEPESFRGLLLRHRGRIGLTQPELAARVLVSVRSVQDWEAGSKFPTAERLQALLRVLLEAGGLTAGQERSEARTFWKAAELQAPRMRTLFDDEWFAGLLAAHGSPHSTRPRTDVLDEPPGRVESAEDWGEAPDTIGFVGRADEVALLSHWVLEERSRLVAVLGIGGIGKTSLASMLAHSAATSFERVYWRSLRNVPPVSEWLAGAVGFLSDQQLVVPPTEP